MARLHDFLAEKNPFAASKASQAIRRGVRLLQSHPEIGKPVEDMPSRYREWVVRFGAGAYVVRYHLDDNHLVVIDIRHSREAGY